MRTDIDWQKYEQVMELKREFYHKFNSYWLHDNLWTHQWWILLAMTIVPWIIWWKVVDRKRIVELFTFAIFIATIAITLDCIGSNYMVWDYPKRLLAYWYPELWPFDIGAVPLPFTLVQQFTNTPKKFYGWTLVAAGFLAFVSEPAMSLLHIYETFEWRTYYSFPIYFLLGCSARWLVLACLRQEKRADEKSKAY